MKEAPVAVTAVIHHRVKDYDAWHVTDPDSRLAKTPRADRK
jgi:hypothetical protein